MHSGAGVQTQFEAAMRQKKMLADDAEATQMRMDSANALLSALAGEEARWTAQSAAFASTIEKLTGVHPLLPPSCLFCQSCPRAEKPACKRSRQHHLQLTGTGASAHWVPFLRLAKGIIHAPGGACAVCCASHTSACLFKLTFATDTES